MSDEPKPKTIAERSSETLAAQVIAYRLLGIDKTGAIEAMGELAARKKSGDDFDYNAFIKEKMDAAPKPNIDLSNMKNLNDILASFKDIK